jgi:hypothetical protein
MLQVELNDMCINIGANNGSEKLSTKKETLRPESTIYMRWQGKKRVSS